MDKNKILSMIMVRLDPNSPENANPDWVKSAGLEFDKRYAVIGEVASIDHYIILDTSNGKILPGMFHLERFEEFPEDEL